MVQVFLVFHKLNIYRVAFEFLFFSSQEGLSNTVAFVAVFYVTVRINLGFDNYAAFFLNFIVYFSSGSLFIYDLAAIDTETANTFLVHT